MMFIVKLVSFAVLFGVYLASDDLSLFLPIEEWPSCPKNEFYQFCLRNCSNCEERGICYSSPCLGTGCDCMLDYVRLTPGGPCEHESKCPKTKCGENEVFRECGPSCEKCGYLNCRLLQCEHRCYCKEGYKRDQDGKCIPKEDCPPIGRCLRHEELKYSGPANEFCSSLQSKEEQSGEIINKTQCYCAENYKRSAMGNCWPEKLCDTACLKPQETFQSCPRQCNTTCWNYGEEDCVEDGQCYPGCFCDEGYYMNHIRTCVKLEECPPGSNPFAPTPVPEIETTIPSSVSSVQTEETTTTPSIVLTTEPSYSSTPEDNTETDGEKGSSAKGVSDETDTDDEEELPENLPDEDIISDEEDIETSKAAVSSTSAPKRTSQKGQRISKSGSRNQKSEQSTSAKASAKLDNDDFEDNE